MLEVCVMCTCSGPGNEVSAFIQKQLKDVFVAAGKQMEDC